MNDLLLDTSNNALSGSSKVDHIGFSLDFSASTGVRGG